MSEDDYNSEDYGEEGEADLFDYVKGGELTAEQIKELERKGIKPEDFLKDQGSDYDDEEEGEDFGFGEEGEDDFDEEDSEEPPLPAAKRPKH